MDQKYDFDGRMAASIVYVRPVEVSELEPELQEQMTGISKVYAVHDQEGQRLALVQDRNLAFALARQNDLAPVSVH